MTAQSVSTPPSPFTRNMYRRVIVILLLIMAVYAVLFSAYVTSHARYIDELRRDELRRTVELALNVIDPIREQHKRGELTQEQALILGTNLIRRMTYTFGTEQHHVYMVGYNGMIMAQSFEHAQPGTTQWDMQDATGKYIIRNQVEVAWSQAGGGYFEYHFLPPGSSQPEAKLSYVVGIPEWEAYIGTGLYVREMQVDTQGYTLRTLLLSGSLIAVILLVVSFSLRLSLRSYSLLQSLFDLVQRQPDTVPDIPLQQFKAGSEGWRLLSSFQTMLTEILHSKQRQREREEQLEQRVKERTHELASLAEENDRLFKEEQARRQESEQRRWIAESLRDVLKTLNSHSPLEESLDKIVTQAARLLDTTAAAIFRLQAGTDILTIQTSYGLPEQYVQQMSVPVGQSILGRAVQERKAVYVPDKLIIIPRYDQVSEHTPTLTLEVMQRFRAVLATPLIIRDDVYGGIVLYYEEPRDFSDEQLEIISVFADQAALAIENARLRAQAEEDAAAAERQRLARELHDAVTQTLFSATLTADVLPRLFERNPDEARKKLEELRLLSRGALAEMRTLLLELRPSVLTEVKLGELIKQLGEAMAGRARIEVAVAVESDCILPAEVQIAIYRITQESLNNVVKHAGATQVVIRLHCTPNRVHLTIHDDGQGFDPQTVTAEHLGLNIMRERADSIGAVLDIESQPSTQSAPDDRGTTVTLLWEAR